MKKLISLLILFSLAGCAATDSAKYTKSLYLHNIKKNGHKKEYNKACRSHDDMRNAELYYLINIKK